MQLSRRRRSALPGAMAASVVLAYLSAPQMLEIDEQTWTFHVSHNFEKGPYSESMLQPPPGIAVCLVLRYVWQCMVLPTGCFDILLKAVGQRWPEVSLF